MNMRLRKALAVAAIKRQPFYMTFIFCYGSKDLFAICERDGRFTVVQK